MTANMGLSKTHLHRRGTTVADTQAYLANQGAIVEMVNPEGVERITTACGVWLFKTMK